MRVKPIEAFLYVCSSVGTTAEEPLIVGREQRKADGASARDETFTAVRRRGPKGVLLMCFSGEKIKRFFQRRAVRGHTCICKTVVHTDNLCELPPLKKENEELLKRERSWKMGAQPGEWKLPFLIPGTCPLNLKVAPADISGSYWELMGPSEDGTHPPHGSEIHWQHRRRGAQG